MPTNLNIKGASIVRETKDLMRSRVRFEHLKEAIGLVTVKLRKLYSYLLNKYCVNMCAR